MMGGWQMKRKGICKKISGMTLALLMVFSVSLTGCTLLGTGKGSVSMPASEQDKEETFRAEDDKAVSGEKTSDSSSDKDEVVVLAENAPASKASQQESGSWQTEAGKTAMAEERQYLKELGAVFGAVFLDYTADYNFPGKKEQREKGYPFLEDIPSDHIVEYDGDEWYAVVPAEDGWTFSVDACSWNTELTEAKKEKQIWTSADGLPFILRCNVSDLHSNVCVTAKKGDQEVCWYPYYILYAGEIQPTDGVVQLRAGSNMSVGGYLYGMEGSWHCDSLKSYDGKPLFYDVSFWVDGQGNPTYIWFSGGNRNGDMEEINFCWDGSYLSKGSTAEITNDQEFEYWMNTPDGIRNGTIRLKREGERLTIREAGGDAFLPFTNSSVTEFYFTELRADGENCDYEGMELELLYAEPSIQEKLHNGMSVMEVEERETINGDSCLVFALGTNREDQFVAEEHYAVSTTGDIYQMDYLTGNWEPV